MKIFLRILSIIFICISVIGLVVYIGNDDTLTLSAYSFNSEKIPSFFRNKKIVQLTDFHNHSLEYSNVNLIDTLNGLTPDYLFLTGDFVDQYTTDDNLDDIEEILKVFNDLNQIYFVNGNHEEYSPRKDDLYQILHNYGVHILDDEIATIYSDDLSEHINIIGIHDPYRDQKDNYLIRNEGKIDQTMETLMSSIDENDFNILLAHRPELIDIYAKHKIDVVFSGHTHGGVINFHSCGVPFVINQGLFPKYTRGKYSYEYNNREVTMYLSSGLGKSNQFPIRYNCNPEIIEVVLS